MQLFDSKNKKLDKILVQIKESIKKYQDLKLSDFKGITEDFRKQLESGKTEEDIMVDAYAAMYCAFNKLDEKRKQEKNDNNKPFNYYDCQVKTSIALNNGDLVQMLTGEGKTYALTLSAYLNAISGKGVHVITSNEYLVERDCKQNEELFEIMGLSAKYVSENMSPEEKREGYNADITYVTASTDAFDYLKDNAVTNKEDRVQRGLNYAIVDELDSILIDSANTPYILSNQNEDSKKMYKLARKVIETMHKYSSFSGTDKFIQIEKPLSSLNKYDLQGLELDSYVVYSKIDRNISISSEGIDVINSIFEKFGYTNEEKEINGEKIEIMPFEKYATYIYDALNVDLLMKKDVDYTISDGKVKIIDNNLGRISKDSKFSQGIHQAIEAKEGVKITSSSITTASITQPNFFGMFNKVAGLSGTLIDAKEELRELYHKDIIEMAPNKELKRIDYDTEVLITRKEKDEVVLKEIIENHKKGRPILLGTESIEECEYYSNLLSNHGITHNTLHAKNTLEEEAIIVSEAGKFGMITITTAMAGRGTDIKVDRESLEAGGLCVIGTNYGNSKRVDDQFRGRAGRQGEVGSSKFIISLDDNIFTKNCKADEIDKIKEKYGNNKDKLREYANDVQRKISANEYGNRKQLNELMNVADGIRRKYYKERDEILENSDIKSLYLNIIQIAIKEEAEELLNGNITLELFASKYEDIFDISNYINELKENINKKTINKMIISIQKELQNFVINKIEEKENLRETILTISDEKYNLFLNEELERKREASLSTYAGETFGLSYEKLSLDKWNEYTKIIKAEILEDFYIKYKDKMKHNTNQENDIKKDTSQKEETINTNKQLSKKEILILVAKAVRTENSDLIALAYQTISENSNLEAIEKNYLVSKLNINLKEIESKYESIIEIIKHNTNTTIELKQIKKEIQIIYPYLNSEKKQILDIYLKELEEKISLEQSEYNYNK